jgi:subtilisin family serine protease
MSWTPPSPEDEGLFPFPGRTGCGVRVAVIDSGVHAAHPHIRSVAGGVSVRPDGTIEEAAFADRLGHGTAVMAAIQERAPDAEYFAVKVFDGALRSTAPALFRAIEWAIERPVDIVNLSLGTTNSAHAAQFERLVERALRAGVAIFAARETEGQACFPGCLRGVFGVSLDDRCERTSYRARETVEGLALMASGYPRPAPGIPKERNLQGISFAVANVSGFAARAIEGMPERSPEELRRALISHCTSSPP